ncbi:MAG: hypothetical protein WDM79_06685 [Terricaulis sp.]
MVISWCSAICAPGGRDIVERIDALGERVETEDAPARFERARHGDRIDARDLAHPVNEAWPAHIDDIVRKLGGDDVTPQAMARHSFSWRQICGGK